MQTQSYLKCSIDGLNGAGKSGTSVRLAVGIAKEYCESAPVVAFDSENRWRFYKRVFDLERVPLIVVPGTSLLTLQEAITRITQEEGAAVFCGDQLTTPWKDGLKSFSFENGMLPFDRRQQLENQWEPVVSAFRYGKFHAICCGRLGYNWTNVEDEDGNLTLVQGDSKFNAGGGNNFGYEADLELEMRRRKRNVLGWLRGKTSVEHICDVVKDAGPGILNGQQFSFASQDGLYKPGDYKQVLDAFRPYLDYLKDVPPPTPERSDTRSLLVSGKTAWAKDQTDRKQILENIVGLWDYCYGSQQSSQGKMFRNLTLESWGFGWSFTEMEENAPTAKLRECLEIMKAVRRRVEQKEIPSDQRSLECLLQLAAEDVTGGSGKHITLLEAMGIESIKQVTAKKKSSGQKIVQVMDRVAHDEVAGD